MSRAEFLVFGRGARRKYVETFGGLGSPACRPDASAPVSNLDCPVGCRIFSAFRENGTPGLGACLIVSSYRIMPPDGIDRRPSAVISKSRISARVSTARSMAIVSKRSLLVPLDFGDGPVWPFARGEPSLAAGWGSAGKFGVSKWCWASTDYLAD